MDGHIGVGSRDSIPSGDMAVDLGLELGKIARLLSACENLIDDQKKQLRDADQRALANFRDRAWSQVDELVGNIAAMQARSLDGALAQLVAAGDLLTDLAECRLDEEEFAKRNRKLRGIVYSAASVLEKHGARNRCDYGGDVFLHQDANPLAGVSTAETLLNGVAADLRSKLEAYKR